MNRKCLHTIGLHFAIPFPSQNYRDPTVWRCYNIFITNLFALSELFLVVLKELWKHHETWTERKKIAKMATFTVLVWTSATHRLRASGKYFLMPIFMSPPINFLRIYRKRSPLTPSNGLNIWLIIWRSRMMFKITPPESSFSKKSLLD